MEGMFRKLSFRRKKDKDEDKEKDKHNKKDKKDKEHKDSQGSFKQVEHKKLQFFDLQDEVIFRILCYLRTREICRFALVSKRCKEIAFSNSLWQRLVNRDWKFPNPSKMDWRQYYVQRYRLYMEERNQRLLNEQQQQEQPHGVIPSANSTLQKTGIELFRDPKYLIAGRYKLLDKLGSGSFGEIFTGMNVHDNEKVAIKLEPMKTRHPQLHYESRVYKALRGGSGIPNAWWFGTEGEYNIMVMDLLSSSLEDLFAKCNRKFSLKTILMLAQQMIRLIEYMHNKNFIHRDIKPDNFVMGRNKKASVVHIIDFGLAKKYRDSKTNAHLPYRTLKSLTGTPRYASLNTHLGIEQSRRDDLESLGYVLMYFCRGSLPWQGLPAKNKKQKYQRITEKKASTTIEQLCEGYPTEFMTYLQYCRSLRFTDKPDYDYLVKLFRDLFQRKGYKYDGIFDWMKDPSELSSSDSASEQKATASNNNNSPTSQNVSATNSNNLSSSVENTDVTSPNMSTQSNNGSTHPITPNGKNRSFTVTEVQMNDRMEQSRLRRDGSVQAMGTNILSMGSLRTATLRSSSEVSSSKDKKEKKDKKDKK